jgi:hypothetical protein
MQIIVILGLVAGALQLAVAGYALRLNRLFGPGRVGWSLFWAFSLLALLYWVQFLTPINSSLESGLTIEVVHSLIALLLFAGLVHLEALLKERIMLESKERQMREILESEVKKQTAYLMRAIEQLETEMEERKRLDGEIENLKSIKTHLFDRFVKIISETSGKSLIQALERESYVLEVDLASQRPLPPLDVGSILIFTRFVANGGRAIHHKTAVVLPPSQITFYRKTIERLIEEKALPSAARLEFERIFAVHDEYANSNPSPTSQLNGAFDEFESLKLVHF